MSLSLSLRMSLTGPHGLTLVGSDTKTWLHTSTASSVPLLRVFSSNTCLVIKSGPVCLLGHQASLLCLKVNKSWKTDIIISFIDKQSDMSYISYILRTSVHPVIQKKLSRSSGKFLLEFLEDVSVFIRLLELKSVQSGR